MTKKSSLRVAITTAMLLGWAASASAVNYGGVGGSPANPRADNPRTKSIFIYTLKPGQQVADGVRVQNNTDHEQTVTVDGVDSELASGGNFTCKQAADPKTDVGSWIQLQSTSVTVAPNSSQVVPFTISIPDSSSVPIGEHDGCITLQAASQTATTSGSGILLSFRTGIRVVVTIPGEIVKKLSVTSVTAKPSGDKYQITPQISNAGNVSLDATLKVKFVSVLGIATNTIDEGTLAILPHSVSSNNYDLNRPFWGGLYRAQALATYNNDPATQLGQGNNQSQVTQSKASRYFFVAPAPLAGLIEVIVIILLYGLAFWLVKRERHNRRINRHWESYSVEDGEDLESLARKFNVSWKSIAKANQLKPPYNVKQGQKLKLPAEPKE